MTPLDLANRKIAKLEAKVEALEDELRSRQVSQVDEVLVALMRGGLTASQAAMLTALHRAYPRVLSREHLDEAAPPMDRAFERGMKFVEVVVCKIREKTGQNAITTIKGAGYTLSPFGLELVKRLLAGEQLPSPKRREVRIGARRAVAIFLAANPETTFRVMEKGTRYGSSAVAQACQHLRKAGHVHRTDHVYLGPGNVTPSYWSLTDAGRKHFNIPLAAKDQAA